MNDYPFTLSDFRHALEMDGRKIKRGGKGFLTNCLIHPDSDPSAEVYPDGWIECFSCAKRYHISNFYPALRDPNWKPETNPPNRLRVMPRPLPVPEQSIPKTDYTKYELFPLWETLPQIPREFDLKGLPLEVLDSLGWRWSEGVHGMGPGILIPYFNHARDSIPFAQVRHISGDRRFTMLPGAEMTLYGKWNLHPGEKLFIVEGCSDAAVLEHACIPWVAIPSASGIAMITNLAKYALKTGIQLVYAGDNDEAGDKLRKAVDLVVPHRVLQPPGKYKDWGEFFMGAGIEKVSAHCWEELREPETPPMEALARDVFNGVPQKSLF